MAETKYVSVTEAAKEKGCSRVAIYNAIKRDDLNGEQVGKLTLICRDRKYGAYAVKDTGGRAHKKG